MSEELEALKTENAELKAKVAELEEHRSKKSNKVTVTKRNNKSYN